MASQIRDTEKLTRWNRRAWQEITILKKRLEIVEDKSGIDTGGTIQVEIDKDENPWDVEIVYDTKYVPIAFVAGFFLGCILMVGILLH